MPPTIKEVAKLAGVSIGTVSRAFNGYRDIQPETKRRIHEAAKTLGYTPNISARNLSSRQPPNIGIIISGLLEGNRKDAGSYLLLQGVFDYASRNGLQVALYLTDAADQRKRSYLQFCAQHSLSGAIVSGITMDDVYLKELIDSELPSVGIDFEVAGPCAGWVSVDNRLAAREMADYLFSLGHREFMVIAGKRTAMVNEERLLGVRDAYAARGAQLPEQRVVYCDFSEEIAREQVGALLQAPEGRQSTAWLCFSDLMAIGAISALTAGGYSVPRDATVTGFDDLPISAFTAPPLTTIHQDMRQIGFESAALLHRMMKEKQPGSHQLVAHQLIARGSSAPPGAGRSGK